MYLFFTEFFFYSLQDTKTLYVVILSIMNKDKDEYTAFHCVCNAEYKEKKLKRREKKRSEKRDIGPEDVLFLFERVLQGFRTIQIYNELRKKNPGVNISKTKIEKYATGNCKVFESELPPDRYHSYLELREKVYTFYKNNIEQNKTEQNKTEQPISKEE